jgi:hypothetical protein
MAARRIEPPERPTPIGPPLPTNYGAIGWLFFWLTVAFIAASIVKSARGY